VHNEAFHSKLLIININTKKQSDIFPI